MVHEARMRDLGEALIQAVERAFGIEDKHDTAATCASPMFTIGEADIQIEVRYTAGEDEYGWGRPFDPNMVEQDRAAELIRMAIHNWLRDQSLPIDTTATVWFKPYYHSYFKAWKNVRL